MRAARLRPAKGLKSRGQIARHDLSVRNVAGALGVTPAITFHMLFETKGLSITKFSWAAFGTGP